MSSGKQQRATTCRTTQETRRDNRDRDSFHIHRNKLEQMFVTSPLFTLNQPFDGNK